MKKERGSILLLTLMFVALTAMVCVTVLEAGILSRQLLFQQQQKAAALLQAENILQQVIKENRELLSQEKVAGFRHCGQVYAPDISCDAAVLQYSKSLAEGESLQLSAVALPANHALQRRWELTIRYSKLLTVELNVGLEINLAQTPRQFSAYQNDQEKWMFF